MQQLNKYIITDLGTEEVSILTEQDTNLISSFRLDNVPFYVDKYQVDLSFYDLNQNYVETVHDIGTYTILGINKQSSVTEITVNPVDDGLENGYLGDIILKYEVSNNIFSPSKDQDTNSNLYVVDISSDRTEIRAKAANLSTKDVKQYVDAAYGKLNGGTYFPEIYLNFFKLKSRATITNIVLETVGTDRYITIKLYQPLPEDIDIKDQFYIQERIGNITAFKVVRDVEIIPDEAPQLRRPNFNVETEEYSTNITDYVNYGELLSYPLNTSNKQLYSIYKDGGVELGIDHTDYSNFIHFSSAAERLENFRYKLSLIKSYEKALKKTLSTTEADRYQKLIEGIISNFDHYDRFLYFENDSEAWPKSNKEKPYINVDPDEPDIQTWWEERIAAAEHYDNNNPDILINTIPVSLREDKANEPYIIFVDMIGQHFDNEWIYAKAIGNRYNADNRLDHGISKDLVRDAIASFGIEICKSNQNLTELFERCNIDGTYNAGEESSVSHFKRVFADELAEGVREFDGKYAPAEAVEETLNGLTSLDETPYRVFDGNYSDSTSVTNNIWQPILVDTYRKEIYKRIYHNLPILIKAKGTNRGLRTLINCFGIPDNILTISVQGKEGQFGPEESSTSSIDRISVDQSSSVVPFTLVSGTFEYVNALDKNVSVESKPATAGSQNSNFVDIGFDLTKQFDTFAQQKLNNFNYNDIIGDSRNIEENYGEAFSLYFNQVLTEASSSQVFFRSPSSIVRLVRYIDSTLYRSIQDFIPAKSSIATGVVVKDNILHRNRYAGLKQSGLNSKIYSGTIQTGSIEAGDGGSFGEANVDYLESWSTAESRGFKVVTGSVHKFDGELSGSNYVVTDGEAIKNNIWNNELHTGNPFAHAGRNSSTYRLNFRFLCLPAQAQTGLDLTVLNTAYRLFVYNYSGSVSYNYSYGVNNYGTLNSSDSVNTAVLGGDANDVQPYTLDGGSVTMSNTFELQPQPVSLGKGSALMFSDVQQLELTANTSSVSNYFMGWYSGQIDATSRDSCESQFLCAGNKLILNSGSLSEGSYTARYAVPGDVPKDIFRLSSFDKSTGEIYIDFTGYVLSEDMDDDVYFDIVQKVPSRPDITVSKTIRCDGSYARYVIPQFIVSGDEIPTFSFLVDLRNHTGIFPVRKYAYHNNELYKINYNIAV